jgi:hypothetical protein
MALGRGKDFYCVWFAVAAKIRDETQCDMSSQPRHRLFGFRHDVDRRARLGPSRDTDARLSLRASALVIAALSLLSWAVVIGIVLAVRALL